MQPNRFNTTTRTESREIDAGLRKYMSNIYARMSAGVLVTAITALFVASSPALMNLFLGGPQAYIVIFAPLAVVMFGFHPERMKASQLMIAFFAISVLYGISFAAIATVALQDAAFAMDVARAFFITSAMFAGLSIYGYTSKTDFSGMRTFLTMGIWGLVALSVANLFFASTLMSNVIAAAGIILFSGLTVWQTQASKEMYNPNLGGEFISRLAWAAALNLYISFIAMFQYVLHFLNQR
jgi:uncharacterized protein